MSVISPVLAQCVESPAAPIKDSYAALVALDQLVKDFAPPEMDAAQADLWICQMVQYLLQSSRDVYLGYLAPTTVQ
jgi:hypothetical protein